MPVKMTPEIFEFAARSFFTTYPSAKHELHSTFTFDDKNQLPPFSSPIPASTIMFIPIYHPHTDNWCLGILSAMDDSLTFRFYDPLEDPAQLDIVKLWAEQWFGLLPGCNMTFKAYVRVSASSPWDDCFSTNLAQPDPTDDDPAGSGIRCLAVIVRNLQLFTPPPVDQWAEQRLELVYTILGIDSTALGVSQTVLMRALSDLHTPSASTPSVSLCVA